MTEALRSQNWDLIVSDYSMPQFSGPMALSAYRQSSSEAPFFLVSGVVGEHIAVEMLKAGAHYYVKKDELARLAPAVRQELAAATERRIRLQTEATAAYLASLVQSCEEAIIGLTLDGKIVSWNGGAERLYGQPGFAMLGRPFASLFPRYRPENLKEMLDRIKLDSRVAEFETVHVRNTESTIEVLVTLSVVKNAEGRVIGASAVVKDITQRKVEEAERLALIQDLSKALGTVNTITGAASGSV
jgi:PAS domain S-box-containing protein